MKQIKVLNWNVVDSEGDFFSPDDVVCPEKVKMFLDNNYSKLVGQYPSLVKRDGLYIECTETVCKQYKGYFPTIGYQRISNSKIKIHHLSLMRHPNIDTTIQPL